MPTIDRIDGYRVFFYSNENDEEPHVHVEAGNKLAKFWLDPISVGQCKGFKEHEITKLEKVINARRHEYLEQWHEFFRSA